MWQATNIQTKEIVTGTEQEILDLDVRQYRNKKQVFNTPKSHSPILRKCPIAYIRTFLKYNRDLHCMSGVFVVPVFTSKCLARSSHEGRRTKWSSIRE